MADANMNGPNPGGSKKRSFMPAELAHRMSCKKDFLKYFREHRK